MSKVVKRPRVVLAGTSSGVGKTTLTIGLMAAFKRKGFVVQGYKAGPDYIDPSYHEAVTGRPSRNLDSWMLEEGVVREVFLCAGQDADLSIVEGVMGFYDGKDSRSNIGSTAHISRLLAAPTILVLNAASIARSAAAIVMGFQRFDPEVAIQGVIVNRVGGEGHYRLIQAAVEQECGIPTLGYLPERVGLQMPERHLGLIPAIERGELTPLFDHLADEVEASIDLERIAAIARAASDLEERSPQVMVARPRAVPITIAVARDAAFNFYYPENLELLALRGARLAYFSPLCGEDIPVEADGLYLGGGFPEEFAEQLAARPELLARYRERIQNGLPTYAECGGYMFLSKAITDKAGRTFPMVGVIPAKVQMQAHLSALGYREVTALADCLLLPADHQARGHEFHYSTIIPDTEADSTAWSAAYAVRARATTCYEGWRSDNVLAGYTHLHFASNPSVADRLINACAKFHNDRANHELTD